MVLERPKPSTQNSARRQVRREGVLLSTGSTHLSLSVSAWEVLCITLKLAKVFPSDRCLALQTVGGEMNLVEVASIRFHIEVILLASMESTDFLMPDLTLADQHPQEAFLEGDPRREAFIDYATLKRLVSLMRDAHAPLRARRVAWRRSE